MAYISAKDNYYQLLKTGMPEYIPAMFFDPYMGAVEDEFIAPRMVPAGEEVKTPWGVPYVGSADIMNGAMPKPGFVLLDDITKWRDVIKNPDLSGFDWEAYYKRLSKDIDREKVLVTTHGGDYFLTLVSFMGFENTLLALYEEPEEVKALLDYISDFYIEVLKKQMQYVKPEIYNIMDDDSAYRAPFFSRQMYQEFFKPYHKMHAEIALENGCFIDRHDCGRCEDFIEDWLEFGVRSWNPAQVSNDLVSIKKKYTGKLILTGCWDNQGVLGSPTCDLDYLRAELEKYLDTFAPGGDFVFSAMIMADPDDVEGQKRAELVKDFYVNRARDYYIKG